MYTLRARYAWPKCQSRRPVAERVAKPGTQANVAQTESMEQLIARSTRDITARVSEIGLQVTSRYFIDQAAQLVAALRLWAEACSQSDQSIVSMLNTLDIPALRDAAHQLREMAIADAKTASWTIELNTNRASRELLAIAVLSVAGLD